MPIAQRLVDLLYGVVIAVLLFWCVATVLLGEPPGKPIAPVAPVVQPDAQPETWNVDGVTCSADEYEAIKHTNERRQQAGLAPLQVDQALMNECRGWARQMAESGRLVHDDSAGRENVAWNKATGAGVVAAWMDSRGHKANILSDSTFLGVAVARGPSGPYWCQRFR